MIISQIQFIKVWIILLLSCTRLCTYQPNLYSFEIQSTEWMFSFFFKRRISSRHIACQCMMVSVLFINTTSSIWHKCSNVICIIITWILTVIIVINTEKEMDRRFQYIYHVHILTTVGDLCKSISSSQSEFHMY